MTKPEFRTLVVGGSYTIIDGTAYVNERWLQMIEIFCANISTPLFALVQVQSDDRDMFSAKFHYEIVPVNPPNGRSWNVSNPLVDWHKDWHRRLVDNVSAVYCRFPSCYWDGYHIYNRALSQGKIRFASFHGDWEGVYKNLASNAPSLKKLAYATASFMAHRALTKVARSSKILFCVGPGLERRYASHAQASMTFANYLHDEDDIYRREDTCLTKPVRIIYVGSLSPRKGVGNLLSVVAKLISKGYSAVLSIVGTGEEEFHLARLAEDLNITAYVEWNGYIAFGFDLFRKYRESDIFVLPSLAGEGMPKVVVEAMSQGLPVVATDTGSTKDIIEASNAGILVTPGDEDGMCRSLIELIENSAIRKKLIANGLKFASQMTNDRQCEIVSTAFREHLPEVMPADFRRL